MSIELLCYPAVYYQDWHCGYCGLEDKPDDLRRVPSSTIGLQMEVCTPDIYEALENRGFRRSGKFLYRNDLLRNCCQIYTIRTSYYLASEKTHFKPNKDQKHCINKVAKYVGADLKNGKNSFDLEQSIVNIHKHGGKSFRTEFEVAEFSEDKFELYKKYQIQVHKDKPEDLSESSFTRFLCRNPFFQQNDGAEDVKMLNDWYLDRSEPFKVTGAFHECYYIDGKLVAVSVMDILPRSVSSVYFIWDPDYHHLGLGNFSALKDMILTHRLGRAHYYLGYYIPNCPKMSYKKKFGGELLDLINHKFVSLDYLEKNNLLVDGKPFVLQERYECASKEVFERELVVETNDLYPSTWLVQPNNKLVNIAQLLYGRDGDLHKSPMPNFRKLQELLLGSVSAHTEWFHSSLCKESDSRTVFSTRENQFTGKQTDLMLPRMLLPPVLLGALPLWKTEELLCEEKSVKLTDLLLFTSLNGVLGQVPALYWKSNAKISSFNLLRLFGPEIHKKSAVFMDDYMESPDLTD